MYVVIAAELSFVSRTFARADLAWKLARKWARTYTVTVVQFS